MSEACKHCPGSGLDPDHPSIHDTPAGKYTDDMLCPRCHGEGTEPE